MPKYKIEKIALPYSSDILEPHISKEIMKSHYDNHYIEYFNSLKVVFTNHPKVQENYVTADIEGNLNRLLTNYCKLEDVECHDKENCNVKKLQSSVRQFGGGVINHNFFFSILSKNKYFNKDSDIGKAIIERFESYEKFVGTFSKAALDIFGSGWAWLVVDNSDHLRVYKTFNQDNPWFLNMTPLIAVDMWEHAYQLQHKNDRKKYLEEFFEVINWEQVDKYYQEYKKDKK